MIENASSSNIYLNVVMRINADYEALIEHLKEMDTRAAYLQIFEVSLSSALPKPLWSTEVWMRQSRLTPMPADPYAVLPFDEFRAWMTVYELVMREEGLIGTKKQMILGLDDCGDANAQRKELAMEINDKVSSFELRAIRCGP